MKENKKFIWRILPLALIFIVFLCILNVVKAQCTELNSNVKLGWNSEIPTIPQKENKKLVAYFSATGTTKKLAEQIAQIWDADLYEIAPQNPYSSEDLNYNDSNSRANIEQNDDNARPAIVGNVQNMEQYSSIILAYPIWWGQAPKIISTFLESYDFSNKTILPFCTSGSSPIGNSAKNLEKCCSTVTTWLEGKRFSANISIEELEQWIYSSGIHHTKPEEENTADSTIKPEDTTNKEEQTLKISFGQYELEAIFEKNSSADAFKELLEKGPITINMSDYGNFEKVGSLGATLPRNDASITTESGDIILYQGNSITIYYDTNTWNFTKLAKIKDSENLKEKLGDGAVLVTFSLNKQQSGL